MSVSEYYYPKSLAPQGILFFTTRSFVQLHISHLLPVNMKFLSLTAGVLLASAAVAAPIEVRQANIDVTVLQFALTLEHLENTFYKEALGNFTQQMFMDAGFSATYYNNVKFIATDEESHVLFLETAITAAGYAPVAACSYNFQFTDVRSFITLSSVLEGVGTSAYLGAAGLITDKATLTAAGSILVTEALHTSMQRGAIGEVPMANPNGTPLDPMAVFTLAASFITACPSTNAALPFTAFPPLMVDGSVCTCEEPSCAPSQITKREPGWGDWKPTSTAYATAYASAASAASATPYCSPPMAGASIMLTAAMDVPAGSYVTFVSGLVITSVKPSSMDGANVQVAIPSEAQAQTYVFITNSDIEGMFNDTAVLFGPAILEGILLHPCILYPTTLAILLTYDLLSGPTSTIIQQYYLEVGVGNVVRKPLRPSWSQSLFSWAQPLGKWAKTYIHEMK
jgi:hypothetical protein